MKHKKILIYLLLTINIIALDNNRGYKEITNGSLNFLNSKEYIDKQSQKANEQFSFIKELQKNNKKNISKEQKKQNDLFIKSLKEKTKGMTYEQAADYINTLYQGNDYLSKEEALSLMKILKGYGAVALQNHDFILYFFSETVPRRATTNVLLDIGILQENGININTKQYLRGPTKDFKDFVMTWKEFINDYTVEHKAYITNNFHLKIDPRFFKTYNIVKAPAMALATCDSGTPDIKNCKIKYLIRGNVSLEVFFDKISKYEKKYKEYVRFLQANKIVKNKR